MHRQLQVHSFLPLTLANGPGARCALWLQGCSLACPGCFNAETHSFSGGNTYSVEEMCSWITSCSGIEGLTISGGEPLQQAEGLFDLLRKLRSTTDLSVLLFSGFTVDEIEKMDLMRDLSCLVDVLISGRYVQDLSLRAGLIGSSNKSVCFFSDRYTAEDLVLVPPCELIISPEGEVSATGIDPVSLR